MRIGRGEGGGSTKGRMVHVSISARLVSYESYIDVYTMHLNGLVASIKCGCTVRAVNRNKLISIGCKLTGEH